jgi:hypothetical protein
VPFQSTRACLVQCCAECCLELAALARSTLGKREAQSFDGCRKDASFHGWLVGSYAVELHNDLSTCSVCRVGGVERRPFAMSDGMHHTW